MADDKREPTRPDVRLEAVEMRRAVLEAEFGEAYRFAMHFNGVVYFFQTKKYATRAEVVKALKEMVANMEKDDERTPEAPKT